MAGNCAALAPVVAERLVCIVGGPTVAFQPPFRQRHGIRQRDRSYFSRPPITAVADWMTGEVDDENCRPSDPTVRGGHRTAKQESQHEAVLYSSTARSRTQKRLGNYY